MRASKKRAYYWDGFRDALVHGARNIWTGMPDSARIAYHEGYDDGQRAISRHLVAHQARSLPGKPGVLR